MEEQHLLVGLGNPGREYQATRHNVGFLTMDYLARVMGFAFKASSFTNGQIAQGRFGNRTVRLLKPGTFMNRSGTAVRDALQFLRIPCSHLLVVCDDINLPFGQMRLRPRGSAGGHNGLRSINALLGTTDFARLRVGVDQPGDKEDLVDFVLGEFDASQRQQLEHYVAVVAECCQMWLGEGCEPAMGKFNRRDIFADPCTDSS